MNIPTITIPKYNVKLTNGNVVQYRSFLVKEEKVLLLAQQTGEVKEIINAIKEAIDVCTFKKLNMTTISTVDLIWLLINIRSKSVGETAKFRIQCTNEGCQKDIECSYDLANIKLPDYSQIDYRVPITSDIGVIMRLPTAEILDVLLDPDKYNKIDQGYLAIQNCIASIYDSKEVVNVNEIKPEDLTYFVENLTKEQFEKLGEKYKSFPAISESIDVKCPHCQTPHSVKLKGLLDFFA